MTAPVRLVVTRRYDAPAEVVFDAWLDVECVSQFLFATPGGVMEKVEINPHAGGGFEVNERRGDVLATHYGTYVEIVRPRRLAFDFTTDQEAAPTRVTIDIVEENGGGCLLTLTHEMDPQWAAYEDRAREGWTMILEGLARTLGPGSR